MRALVTSTRQPFGLDEVRKLGRTGHEVFAMDPLPSAPGSHSRFVVRRLACASARFEPLRFVEDVANAMREHRIDLYLPVFEEIFYAGKHLGELRERGDVFCSPFETLARLHHKARMVELAQSLGVRTPATTVVEDDDALRAATERYERFVARAAFSRGGSRMLTNVGPLRGLVPLERCRPTAENPWLVQEYVEGSDLCTFSVVRSGRLAAHCTYVHPVELEHGSGIVYRSVDSPEALEVVARLVGAIDFHGQIGFDFRRTERGELVLLECNPRATAGVLMMSPEDFTHAVIGPVPRAPTVVPEGVKRKISLALVRQMLVDPKLLARGMGHLFSRATKDVFYERGDPMPALSQLLTYPQIASYRRFAGPEADRRTVLIEAYGYDMAWDGQAIP